MRSYRQAHKQTVNLGTENYSDTADSRHIATTGVGFQVKRVPYEPWNEEGTQNIGQIFRRARLEGRGPVL